MAALPRNSLQAALEREAQPVQPPPPVAVPALAATPAEARARKRDGLKLIAGHFPPATARQLRMLAAEEDSTVQALLEEALDLLFAKKARGKF